MKWLRILTRKKNPGTPREMVALLQKVLTLEEFALLFDLVAEDNAFGPFIDEYCKVIEKHKAHYQARRT